MDWAKAHYTAEGEARGALRAQREDLRLVLEERFGCLPVELINHIETCEDFHRLRAAFAQALGIHALEELHLYQDIAAIPIVVTAAANTPLQ